jgi:alkyl sulfatase BDS1-like metallo-beta-lactamase superfamily hydrolase
VRRESLPFDDRRDFDEARKGFIAAPSVLGAGRSPVGIETTIETRPRDAEGAS